MTENERIELRAKTLLRMERHYKKSYSATSRRDYQSRFKILDEWLDVIVSMTKLESITPDVAMFMIKRVNEWHDMF